MHCQNCKKNIPGTVKLWESPGRAGGLLYGINWEHLADIAVELSYAEVARAGEEAMKNVFIDKKKHITEDEIANMLTERKKLKERLQRIW